MQGRGKGKMDPMTMLKRLLLQGTGPMVGVLLGASLVTVVGAHGGDPAKIHSCVNPSSGGIAIVDANAECEPSERALDWNIRGIQGPPGPKGDPGPTGHPGATWGPGWQMVSAPNGPNTAALKVAVAECPGTKKLLGGGATTNTQSGFVKISCRTRTGPQGPTSSENGLPRWRIWSPGDWTLTAFAICANVNVS